MQTPSVQSSSPSRASRRVIFTIIIVAVLLVLGWVLYEEYYGPAAQQLTPEQEQASLTARMEASTAATPPISDERKAEILNQMEKANATPSSSSGNLSAEQKARILNSLGEQE